MPFPVAVECSGQRIVAVDLFVCAAGYASTDVTFLAPGTEFSLAGVTCNGTAERVAKDDLTLTLRAGAPSEQQSACASSFVFRGAAIGEQRATIVTTLLPESPAALEYSCDGDRRWNTIQGSPWASGKGSGACVNIARSQATVVFGARDVPSVARFEGCGLSFSARAEAGKTPAVTFSLPEGTCVASAVSRTLSGDKNATLVFTGVDPAVTRLKKPERVGEKWIFDKNSTLFLTWDFPRKKPVFLKKLCSFSLAAGTAAGACFDLNGEEMRLEF
jgi:hypothetical protein